MGKLKNTVPSLMKKLGISSLLLSAILVLAYCKHKPDVKPDDTGNAEPISNFQYSVDTLILYQGIGGTSVVPTFSGSSPATYSISVLPIENGITIENNGVITVDAAVPVDTFTISLNVTNAAGTKNFANIYTIIVNPGLAIGVSYSPNSFSFVVGNSGTSAAPVVEGGATPITYSLSSSPSTADITINPTSGIIAASTSLAIGNYTIAVTATNVAGAVTFTNAYAVEVTAVPTPPSNLVYPTNTITIGQGGLKNSVTPTISGTSPISYTMSSSPVDASISINSATGVITVNNPSTIGTYTISVDATNTVNTVNFPSVYTINVVAPITFAADIRPILVTSCDGTSCHPDDQIDITLYANAVTKINDIISRTNRTQGSSGFMPKNETKLTQPQLDLIQRWLDDGLKP